MSGKVIEFAKRKRPSKKVLREKYIQESSCSTDRYYSEAGKLRAFQIRFWGALANIPSLKNKKIPGQNFINPDVMARIEAMQVLFKEAEPKPPHFSGNVLLILVCKSRPRSFDVIGCLETVQDWLEPASKLVGKKQHKRGWGVGLIDNDDQVTPFPCKADLFLTFNQSTTILLVPMPVTLKRVDLSSFFVAMGYLSKEEDEI